VLSAHTEDTIAFLAINGSDPICGLEENGTKDISRSQCLKEIKESFERDIVDDDEEKETIKRRKLMEEETADDEDEDETFESLLIKVRHGHRISSVSSPQIENVDYPMWHRRLTEEMHGDGLTMSSVLRDHPIYPNGIETTHQRTTRHSSSRHRSEMSPTLEARIGMRSVVRWEWFLSSILASPVHTQTDFREVWCAMWSLHQDCETSTIRDRTQTQLCLISTHLPLKFLVGWFEGVLRTSFSDKRKPHHHDTNTIHESRQHAVSSLHLIADVRFDPFIRSICVQDAWFYIWMMHMWQKHADEVEEAWEMLCKMNIIQFPCRGMAFAECFVESLRAINDDEDGFAVSLDELENVLCHYEDEEILAARPSAFAFHQEINPFEWVAVSAVGMVILTNNSPAICQVVCLLFGASFDKCGMDMHGHARRPVYFELFEKHLCIPEMSSRIARFCLKIVQKWRKLVESECLSCHIEGINDVEVRLEQNCTMKLPLQSAPFPFSHLDGVPHVFLKDERKHLYLEMEDLFSGAVHAAEEDIDGIKRQAQSVSIMSDIPPLDETRKDERVHHDTESDSDESCEDDVILL
jgi:hypothetical protein